MIYLLITAVVVLYMMPWLILHGWVLYQMVTITAEELQRDETFKPIMGVLLVFGVIPIVNLLMIWFMFIDERIKR